MATFAQNHHRRRDRKIRMGIANEGTHKKRTWNDRQSDPTDEWIERKKTIIKTTLTTATTTKIKECAMCSWHIVSYVYGYGCDNWCLAPIWLCVRACGWTDEPVRCSVCVFLFLAAMKINDFSDAVLEDPVLLLVVFFLVAQCETLHNRKSPFFYLSHSLSKDCHLLLPLQKWWQKVLLFTFSTILFATKSQHR